MQNKSILADLQGQIERITYTKEENGFTIAKVEVYGQRDFLCSWKFDASDGR